MNAAVYHGPNDIRLENLDLKNRTNMKMQLLKVLSCSVCSYDVRTFRNGNFKVTPPIVLGHEICAEMVDDYKSRKFHIRNQKRVVVYPIIPCLKCWYCKNRKFNLCGNLREIGSTLNGGFAEYLLVPNEIFEIGGIVPVSDNITNEEASLTEPLACCINSISKINKSEFGSAIIFGDGPIGLMQLMLLKKFFNFNVTIIGKISHRLATAEKLGADQTLLTNEDTIGDTIREIKANSDRNSPNLVFISNNNPECVTYALDIVNKNGKIIVFSGLKKSHLSRKKSISIELDPNLIHYSQISITGSFSSTPHNLKQAMSLLESNEIQVSNLITNVYPLENIREAFQMTENYSGIKSIVNKF